MREVIRVKLGGYGVLFSVPWVPADHVYVTLDLSPSVLPWDVTYGLCSGYSA